MIRRVIWPEKRGSTTQKKPPPTRPPLAHHRQQYTYAHTYANTRTCALRHRNTEFGNSNPHSYLLVPRRLPVRLRQETYPESYLKGWRKVKGPIPPGHKDVEYRQPSEKGPLQPPKVHTDKLRRTEWEWDRKERQGEKHEVSGDETFGRSVKRKGKEMYNSRRERVKLG